MKEELILQFLELEPRHQTVLLIGLDGCCMKVLSWKNALLQGVA